MKNYGKLTGGLVAAWFVLALAASALHLFTNTSNRFGGAVAVASQQRRDLGQSGHSALRRDGLLARTSKNGARRDRRRQAVLIMAVTFQRAGARTPVAWLR